MIRSVDDLNRKPCVGLLYEDGSITRHYLDVSRDVIEQQESSDNKVVSNADKFVKELGNLAEKERIDFLKLVKQQLIENPELREGVKAVLRKIIQV